MSNDVNETLYRLLEREQATVPCPNEGRGGLNSALPCRICGNPLAAEIHTTVPDPTVPPWLTVLLHGVPASEGNPAMDGLMQTYGQDTLEQARRDDDGFLRVGQRDHIDCRDEGECGWAFEGYEDCRGTGFVPNPLFAELVSKGEDEAACGFIWKRIDTAGISNLVLHHYVGTTLTSLDGILDAVCKAAGVKVRS